ncbi:MAG: DUF2703 domain-containing protein [Candidatus Kapaibacteriales bacterium]
MLVQVLYFPGCPNSQNIINYVCKALEGLDGVEYEELLIQTQDEAQRFNFFGSPTLLINGNDFEGLAKPEQISLSCRFYPNGIPTTRKLGEEY